MRIDPPFDKQLTDWYEHSTFKLRRSAQEMQILIDEEEKKKKNNQGDSFRLLVYQILKNDRLWMAHLYEEMHLVLLMANILSVVVSQLPDKKVLEKFKTQQRELIENVQKNRSMDEYGKKFDTWLERALKDQQKEDVI